MKGNHQKKSKNLLDYKSENPKVWFYRLKGSIENINSEKEKKIAQKLPNRISKRYLETRGYMRKSLGQILNLDPIGSLELRLFPIVNSII